MSTLKLSRRWTSMIAVATLSFAGFQVTDAFADAQQDYYSQLAQQRYFQRPQLARSFSMEGSSIPIAADSSSIIGNPAGLGFMKDGEVAGSYSFGELAEGKDWPAYNDAGQSIREGTVLGAVPIIPKYDRLPEAGNIGLGWTGYNTDTTDNNNTHTKGTQLHAAYGKYIPDIEASLGYGLTWAQDSMSTDVVNYDMYDGFRHTFGFQMRPADNITVGGSFYFGTGSPDIKTANSGRDGVDVDAHGFDIGFGYREANTLFTMAADYNRLKARGDLSRFFNIPDGDESGTDYAFKAGVEQEITKEFLLRAGYRYQGNQAYRIFAVDELSGSSKYNAASLGIGLRLDYVVLDYGVEVRFIGHDEEWQHVVTATFPFGLCEEHWT